MAVAMGVVKKHDPGVLFFAGLLSIGGIVLLAKALAGTREGIVPTAPPRPGEEISEPTAALLETVGVIRVRIGQHISISNPTVVYLGTGRNAYTFFQIRQRQDSHYPTVYGSGVAGSYLPSATVRTRYGLVSPEQPQPDGTKGPILTAYPWPGVPANPISGAPPRVGPADALIEIYELRDPRIDGSDGYANPTENPRVPVARRVYPGKILFVRG